MPKGRLSEKLVQQRALEWLTVEHYAKRKGVVGKPYIKAEAKLVDGNRADGLVVCRLGTEPALCVSLEAKSSKTIRQVRGASAMRPVVTWATVTASLVAIGFLYGVHLSLILRVPLALALFVVAWLLSAFALALTPWCLAHAVVEQVMRYPGHERWIALPADMFGAQHRTETVRVDCASRGIGLLLVSRGAQSVRVIEYPKVVESPKEDLLSMYKCAPAARAALGW